MLFDRVHSHVLFVLEGHNIVGLIHAFHVQVNFNVSKCDGAIYDSSKRVQDLDDGL
jgi:hypothetical protein